MNIGIKSQFDETTILAAVDNEWELKIGDRVVFQHGEKKELWGEVIFFDRKKVTTETLLAGSILRKATKKDLEKSVALAEKSTRALTIATEKVAELQLAMRIVKAVTAFDESEVNFFFMAEERVDFRELVPRLAGALKTRVHLQQYGPRDRARAVGGLGICGREQCCTSGVVREFHTVTMDMARSQELIMKGAEKLSGNCGKLLCCLAYEVEEYEKLRIGMPEYGSRVKTKKGEAKVIGLDILNQLVKVWVEGAGVEVLPVGEVEATKTIRGKGAYKPHTQPRPAASASDVTN